LRVRIRVRKRLDYLAQLDDLKMSRALWPVVPPAHDGVATLHRVSVFQKVATLELKFKDLEWSKTWNGDILLSSDQQVYLKMGLSIRSRLEGMSTKVGGIATQ